MTDDDRAKRQKLIGHGSGLVGAAAGGALGFIAEGPIGAGILASAAYLIAPTLERITLEMCSRVLSSRETMRVGAAIALAETVIRERLDRGDRPRDDGFFTRDGTDRSAADQLYEGVLLKCQKEHQEKKLRHIASIFANAAFLDISATDANAVLLIAERLSYRQMCLVAAVGGDSGFPGFVWCSDIDGMANQLNYHNEIVLSEDFVQLWTFIRLIGGPMTAATRLEDGHVGLTSLGEMCFTLMDLAKVPQTDVNPIVASFRAAVVR